MVAAVAISVALATAATVTAAADPPPAPTYLQAVQDAYDLVRGANPSDPATARAAAAALQAGTGRTQPEILSDLQNTPPDYDDARARLAALLAALEQPATTADPQLAHQRLQQVLAMHRYDALRRPPSPLDRFVQWVGDRINDLLQLLFGGAAGPNVPSLFLYVVGIVAVGAVAFFVFRSARGRFNESVTATLPPGPHAPADYFDEADRLAAAGDRVAAIRALCAGVAATLAGERTWEGSPLTVREIFQRAPEPRRLRPLLVPFEGAVYGGWSVDAETYERAALAAAPFRRPASVAA